MLIESLLPWNAWHCCETLGRLAVVRSGGQARDMCEREPGAGHQQVESGQWTRRHQSYFTTTVNTNTDTVA